jgi:hypothetical protein
MAAHMGSILPAAARYLLLIFSVFRAMHGKPKTAISLGLGAPCGR